ncbi:MAG TPA: amino acid adenylation domain-containing protein [Roseiflexaceae bacterium]|nr:amino acid adenylation domain-containing protein [Roseiflexaceae bacterium]
MADIATHISRLSTEKQRLLAQLLQRKGGAANTFPVSSSQRQLWFLNKLAPESTAYHMFAAFRLGGALDGATLRQSFQTLIERHAALRTVFMEVDGRPVQQVLSEIDPAAFFRLCDLDQIPAAEQPLRVRELALAENSRPFDLARGPLLRVAVLRLSDTEHVLLLTLHHIISDGWSIEVLFRELADCYAAHAAGRAPALPPLEASYADFVRWQQDWLSGARLERRLAFWREQLSGTLPILELPSDRPRPAVQSSHGAARTFTVEPGLTAALRALGERAGATLFMTLLASFNVLLSRLSNQTDVLVGTPVANRSRPEYERLIGLFVNTLVLRTNLADDPTFDELLARVRETTLNAYEWQDLPLDRLIDTLDVPRDLSYSPLFQSMFTLQNAPKKALELGGLVIEQIDIDDGTTKCDLNLSVEEQGAALVATLEYSTDLFDGPTIDRLVAQYQELLRGIVAQPHLPVGRLPLLPPDERRLVVDDWNATGTAYPAGFCVQDLFAAQAARTPDAQALVAVDGALTYAELETRANQLAHLLQSAGAGPEMLVGVCLERSLDLVVALLAVLKSGGAYVPLDPALPPDRLLFVLEDAGAALILTQEHLRPRLPATERPILTLDGDGGWERYAALPAHPPHHGARPDNLAYVLYTSGSTGRPKGAMITHDGLTNYLSWATDAYRVAEGTGAPVHSPIGFDLTVTSLFTPLMCGRCVDLLPEAHGVEALQQAIQNGDNLSLLKLTPAHVQALNHVLPAASLAGRVRALVIGGEALTAESVAFWRANAPETRLINEYGPTETVVGCCIYEVAPEDGASGALPIGRPIANTQLYVLDRHMQPVPVGVAGELYIGGAGVARGYRNRPDLTAERFVPNPFGVGGAGGWGLGAGEQNGEPRTKNQEPGADDAKLKTQNSKLKTYSSRLYKTGDLARWRADGQLEYLGRLDFQVKIRGYRIELGEIETALSLHPAVREAVVLARDGSAGAAKRLVAYVVPAAETGAALPQELRAFLAERLPEYMLPSAVVVLAQMPVNANGKVDRKALPAPDADLSAAIAFVAPRTEVERLLADLWSQTLGRAQVGIHDNFFALGGDSILSIQVIARANQAGLRITPKQMFQHQTIAELAPVVAAAAPAPEADQSPVTGALPLTPIQRFFFEQELPDRHHWNQSLLLTPAEPLDPAALEGALARLLEHHDALRLRFRYAPGGWRQEIVAPGERPNLTLVDLAGLSPAAQRRLIDQTAAALHTGLDIERGPLLRAALFADGPRPGRLLLVIHHLAVDGVSWRILMDDLERAYRQLRAGTQPELPPKTLSLKAWAEYLAQTASSAAIGRELPFWRGLLRDAPARLPRDHTNGANSVAMAERVSVELDVEQTRALLHDVPRAYNTQINDALLSALALAFAEWTGGPRLLIDLEGHGRLAPDEQIDLSRTVGWFTALYPVLLETASGPLATLRAVKEQLRRTPGHGLGYGLLRYLSADGAPLGTLPQPEVVFNYLGQIDSALPQDSLFVAIDDDSGPNQSPRGQRRHLLEINGQVSGGRLRLDWWYSGQIHRRETIGALAGRYIAALAAIIDGCRAPSLAGWTPSDFPLARLGQAQLDALFAADPTVAALYPLAPLQQGLLFHSLYAPGSGDYINQACFRLSGPLDAALFVRAWQQAVDRYDILRTGFVWAGLSEPHQAVWPQVLIPTEQIDWSELTPAQRERRLDGFLEADRARGFDLARPPLTRVAIIRTAPEEYLCVWTVHHAVMDGWSTGPLVRDVFALYEALVAGQPAQLAPVRPYQDYIAWLQRQDSAAAASFWRDTLAGFTTPTTLGVDRGAGQLVAGQSRYSTRTRALPAATTEALQQFARAQRITLNTLLQGAWALLLHHYSGTDDVVFGTTVAGRPADLPAVETMVGLFVNTLPVRARLAPQARLSDWLHELHAAQIELGQYEYAPLVDVQRWSAVPRGTPLFESLLVVENYPLDRAALPSAGGVTLAEVRSHEQASYPLVLVVEPGAELVLDLLVEGARFDDATAAELLEHLELLLERMLAAPDQPLAALPALGPAEAARVLGAWNATAAPFPDDVCIHQIFEAQAERIPDAPALVFDGQTLTYAEVNRRANRIAHHLRAQGVGPERLVAIALERTPEQIIALLAVLKAGGAYVPVDPSYPADRVAYMLEDSRTEVIITRRALAERLPAHRAAPVELDIWTPGPDEPDSNPLLLTTPDSLAYVIYTSGSTGRPKGTLLAHRGLCNVAEAQVRTLGVGDNPRMLQFASLSFDASIFEIAMAWRVGAALYLPTDAQRMPGPALATFLAEQAITTVTLPPTALLAMEGAELPALRTICVAGEACPAELVARWAPGRRFFNLYGPTETTIWATAQECVAGAGAPPIGRPIANTQCYVLDPHMRPVPVGVPGELYLGGVGLARGYLNRPELTAERFVPNPFGVGGAGGWGLGAREQNGEPSGTAADSSNSKLKTQNSKLYKTGDRARWRADGTLEFLGRIDFQVKLRGFRIELGEVEAVLAQHPALRELVVVARTDEPGQTYLAAYVVPQSASADVADALPAQLRAFLRERLPEYMQPSTITVLPAMPLNANGKIDRKALPAPDRQRSLLDNPFVAPRDSLECRLAQIWEELLNVYPVGATDNFFDLGGHSILAVRMIFQASALAGRDLPLATLFQAPTVELLAQAIRCADDRPWSPLVAIQPAGTRPPIFCVHAHGGGALSYYELARALGPDQPFYGLQAPGLDGEQEALTDISEMARLYIEAMRSVQPEGPYRIGGHSFGGLVVYEMAQQLRAQGQEIALLAVFDTIAPVSSNLPGPVALSGPSDLPTSLVEIVELVRRLTLRDLSLTLDELRPLDTEAQLQLALDRLKAVGFFPPEAGIKPMRGLLTIHHASEQIGWRYFSQARPLAQPLTLFVAETLTAADVRSAARELADDPTLGWSALIEGPITCCRVPGDHISMLARPHVETLAARLAERLDACAAEALIQGALV